ncbi:MAG: hypothetical protein D6743_17500 [Calditrichaeota bacterium]|nr:MAG: hypothetical protein D6743_17500 [Calditrichota bacterium]
MDSHTFLFLLLSLLLLLSGRVLWSTVSLVLSFLTKFIAVLFLPVVALFKKENRMLVGLSFTVLVAALYLPYADVGMRLFKGLGAYADKWQFNSSLFALLFTGVKAVLPRSWVVRLMIEPYGMSADAATLASRTTDLALLVSKGVVALVFAGIFLTYVVRLKKDIVREGEVWVFRLGLILLGTFFLLTPTVYPWYLTWLVAFFAVAPSRAWVLLTGLVGLAYWVHIDFARTGRWEVPAFIKYLEYLPFFALLLFDDLRIRLRRFRAPTVRLEFRQSSR